MLRRAVISGEDIYMCFSFFYSLILCRLLLFEGCLRGGLDGDDDESLCDVVRLLSEVPSVMVMTRFSEVEDSDLMLLFVVRFWSIMFFFLFQDQTPCFGSFLFL